MEKFIKNKYTQVALRVGLCVFQCLLLFGDTTLSLPEKAVLMCVTIVLLVVL